MFYSAFLNRPMRYDASAWGRFPSFAVRKSFSSRSDFPLLDVFVPALVIRSGRGVEWLGYGMVG